MRYPHGQRWVTVSKAETRRIAANAAAAAYRDLINTQGDTASQCRVVSSGQLVREGGQRGLRRAHDEAAERDTAAMG